MTKSVNSPGLVVVGTWLAGAGKESGSVGTGGGSRLSPSPSRFASSPASASAGTLLMGVTIATVGMGDSGCEVARGSYPLVSSGPGVSSRTADKAQITDANACEVWINTAQYWTRLV